MSAGYDAFEVSKVGVWEGADGELIHEQILSGPQEEPLPDYVMYTVYGHIPDQGVEALEDFDDLTGAIEHANKIAGNRDIHVYL